MNYSCSHHWLPFIRYGAAQLVIGVDVSLRMMLLVFHFYVVLTFDSKVPLVGEAYLFF